MRIINRPHKTMQNIKKSDKVVAELEVFGDQVAAIAELISERIVFRSAQIGAGSKKVTVMPRYDGILVELIGSKSGDTVVWQIADPVSGEKINSPLVDESGWQLKELPVMPDTELQKLRAQEINTFFGCETCRLMPKDEFFSYRVSPYEKKVHHQPAEERPAPQDAEPAHEPRRNKVRKESKAPLNLAAGFSSLELISKLENQLRPLGLAVHMGLDGEPIVDSSRFVQTLNKVLYKVGTKIALTPQGIPVALRIGSERTSHKNVSRKVDA